MARFQAVVHVCWELPFALRLAPRAFFVWEPENGVAVLDPRPRVGDLIWSRTSSILPATAIFKDIGPPNQYEFPDHDYLLTAQLASGEEVPTVKLVSGPGGGFVEPRAYTHLNLFLCLSLRADYHDSAVMERAGRALNNLLEVYSFVTLDPLVRSIRIDKDCYYAMTSVADVPKALQHLSAEALLGSINELEVGHILGSNRSHTIGLNSFEDLFVGNFLAEPHVGLVINLARSHHQLELFHQLVFSAIRRLKRHEEALAVLDAQSAFEAFVAVLVREDLQRQGIPDSVIETRLGYGGPLHLLQRRLERLDAIAASQIKGHSIASAFRNSREEGAWRTSLYRLRNRIIHEGLQTVSFAQAKAGLVAGLHGMHAIQALHPQFNRQFTWSGAALDLDHVQQTAGRVSRLFEA